MPPPKAKRTTEESLRLRRDIVTRLESGEKQKAIAAELGVSRQYVHMIAKDVAEMGAEQVLAKPTRGAPRFIPLTPDEARMMRSTMATTKPSDHGYEGDKWTIATIKKWTRANLDRVYSARRVRNFFKKWKLELDDPMPEDPYTRAAREALQGEHYEDPPLPPPEARPVEPAAPPRRKRGRPRKNPLPVDPLDDDIDEEFPSLEAMRKSIEEWQAKQKTLKPAKPAGKRSKGRALHRTPSKKKRRK